MSTYYLGISFDNHSDDTNAKEAIQLRPKIVAFLDLLDIYRVNKQIWNLRIFAVPSAEIPVQLIENY
jgi:hypothetical protein